MLRAVFLDIDNTLLDFDAFVRDAMTTGFRHFGYPPYDESMFPVFRRVNTALWRELEQGRLSLEALWVVRWGRIFEALGIEGDGPAFEQFFHDRLQTSVVPVEGAMEALEYLSGRYPLYGASNGPHEQQVNRLRLAGMDRFFTDCFTSEGLGIQKPDPEFFRRALAAANRGTAVPLRPGEVLMLGDSLSSDIAGAAAAGMKSCLYAPGGVPERPEPKPDYIIRRMAEVREIL